MGKKIRITVDVTEMGKLGGKARALALGPKGLSDAGRKAVQARWDAYYAANPDKLKTRRSGASRLKTTKRKPKAAA